MTIPLVDRCRETTSSYGTDPIVQLSGSVVRCRSFSDSFAVGTTGIPYVMEGRGSSPDYEEGTGTLLSQTTFRRDTISQSSNGGALCNFGPGTKDIYNVTPAAFILSLATGVVTPGMAPGNLVVPTITGTAQVDQTLTALPGTWSNSPTSYARQWMRGGVAISGATALTYVPVTGDIGATLTFSEVASNASGPATSAATSAPTAAVIAASSGGGSATISGAFGSGTVGSAYYAQMTTSGFVGAITATVGSGTLPAGLTLSVVGTNIVLSGTPTAAGTSAFVVHATGASSGAADSASQSVAVANAASLSVSGTAGGGTVGTAYPGASFTASGGVAPYTYSVGSGSLPAGLALNASTGAVTGTPTTAGSSTFVIHAVDSTSGTPLVGNSASQTVTIAAAVLDTRPGVFYAASTIPSPAYSISNRVILAGGANGGHAGSASIGTYSGVYAWFACVASGSTGGVMFTDASGATGGWSGAGLPGDNTGASPNPSMSTDIFTDSNGTSWRLFRQDYVNSTPTPMTTTVS